MIPKITISDHSAREIIDMEYDSDEESEKVYPHRIEHATHQGALCQQWQCKAQFEPIHEGHLRVGFWRPLVRMYMWKHWRCLTASEITNLYDTCNGIPEDIPGFTSLEEETMEHVLKCFEHRKVLDRKFFGARMTMLGLSQKILVAVAPPSINCCYSNDCGTNIEEGALKLGRVPCEPKGVELLPKWYHWECLNEDDIDYLILTFREPSNLEGFLNLKREHQTTIEDTFMKYVLKWYPKGIPKQPKHIARSNSNSSGRKSDNIDTPTSVLDDLEMSEEGNGDVEMKDHNPFAASFKFRRPPIIDEQKEIQENRERLERQKVTSAPQPPQSSPPPHSNATSNVMKAVRLLRGESEPASQQSPHQPKSPDGNENRQDKQGRAFWI